MAAKLTFTVHRGDMEGDRDRMPYQNNAQTMRNTETQTNVHMLSNRQ